MRILNVILYVLIFNFSSAQTKDCACNYITDYYQLVYKGQLNFLKENYDSAYVYLKQAEKNCPLLYNPQTNEIGMLAEISARKSLYDETMKYMEMKLRNGENLDYYETDSIFAEFRKQKQWTEIKLKSERLYQDWYANLNLDLRKELIQMNKEDQRVRTKDPIDFEEMKRVDSINLIRLKDIFKEYGYPSQKLIGNWMLDKEIADVSTMIMHIHGEENLAYFKPIFLKWVQCGKTENPTIYANLIDSNDRLKEIFTYGIYDNVGSEKIEDFENIDSRRTSVGLSPWGMGKEIHRLISVKYNLEP